MSELLIKCAVCQALLDEEDLFCSNCGTEAPHAQKPQVAAAGEATVRQEPGEIGFDARILALIPGQDFLDLRGELHGSAPSNSTTRQAAMSTMGARSG